MIKNNLRLYSIPTIRRVKLLQFAKIAIPVNMNEISIKELFANANESAILRYESSKHFNSSGKSC